ncbi:unnamed protein product [Paramecium sonneborni]|uniref:Cyclic nucleotide-binding domain-containing protein n=1 Tax=Paramecium sonneborni TaxID=65129 RepID=A0A8S1PPN9_9CILI|nr:unnamed protein product [Paramecium sonneborni]
MLISKSLFVLDKEKQQVDYNSNIHKRVSQEQKEHQTNLKNCQLKPQFIQMLPHQPNDLQSNEELKIPTIPNNVSHKSTDQQIHRQESKKFIFSQEDSSFLSPSQMIQSHLLQKERKHFYNNGKVKIMIEQIKQRLLNSIHYSKYNDPLITHEFQEVSPFQYYYFTLFMFLTSFSSSMLTIILIPLNKTFQIQEFISLIIFCYKIVVILLDLYFQRGPYKLFRGKIIQNYKNQKKMHLDLFRLLILLINYNLNFDNQILMITLIMILIILEMLRIVEPFENLYRSTHYIVIIIQLWISIIISLICSLKIFDDDEDQSLSLYLSYSISLLTHNGNISLHLNEKNLIVVSIFSIICYWCYVYTFILLWIWIKPNIEIQEEKQKLLKGFVEHFQEKCKDYDLLRRCYSYLEYRIDEDLGRAKEQIMKKLSPALQDEIEIALRTKMIEKIELMNKFSSQFKQQLLYMIEQVTFNPEDNILIEHKAEDLSLYYILKGEVKVQFQGSSLANNKRSVTRLVEGQAFGLHSFISGMPSNISIYSCGVTQLMKLKRSDFLEIISNYPEDNERFSMMKDNSHYNQFLFDCYYCKIRGDYIVECRHLQYFPQRQNVLERYLYSTKQYRKSMIRKQKRYLTLRNLNSNQERIRSIINAKQSQEAISEELQDFSQLPYSENQTHSASQLSNSMPFQKASQDFQVSNSNFNVDSIEQFNDEEEADEVGIIIPKITIRRKRDDSNRTAGFLGNPANFSLLDKDEKEILFQLQEDQNKDCKQMVMVQNNRNNQQIIQQNQKSNLRQLTNRSKTNTNSFSRDISNNPSQNSKQNKSLKLSNQTREIVHLANSINTLSDENKLKQKSGTRQSNLCQQSQFQALSTPENEEYLFNDLIFNQFETMRKFKIYYPHNNFDCVIKRFKNSFDMKKFKIKKVRISEYSIKCFVASKIKKVLKLIRRRQ